MFRWETDANAVSTQLGALSKACEELRQSEHGLSMILAMVLTIGNYINGGTARGQAYGVKLDVLAKLSTIKTNPQAISSQTSPDSLAMSCGGTLLHFVAWEIERR